VTTSRPLCNTISKTEFGIWEICVSGSAVEALALVSSNYSVNDFGCGGFLSLQYVLYHARGFAFAFPSQSDEFCLLKLLMCWGRV
jgi:hypothetical protein